MEPDRSEKLHAAEPVALAGRKRLAVEGWIISALFVMSILIWIFLEIADEVSDNDTQHFDEKFLLALRNPADLQDPLGPWWLEIAAGDITALGGTTSLLLLIWATCGFLWLAGKHRAMWLVLIAAGGGQLISSGLKSLYSRPRPEVVSHLTEVQTSSFPSGHSMMSAVVYLTLGALVSQLIKSRNERVYVLALSCIMTILVGLSRMYLGVHYLTDVAAGWCVGLAWALGCIVVFRFLQNRGKVEQPGLQDGAEGQRTVESGG